MRTTCININIRNVFSNQSNFQPICRLDFFQSWSLRNIMIKKIESGDFEIELSNFLQLMINSVFTIGYSLQDVLNKKQNCRNLEDLLHCKLKTRYKKIEKRACCKSKIFF